METVKILEKKENLNWDYDEDADVLYISMAKPVKALGLDVGEGIIEVSGRNRRSSWPHHYRRKTEKSCCNK